IQYQSRVREEHGIERAALLGVPTIATAAAATAAGFLVLALSPVPMVREFGLLLVAGIVLALACALTAGTGVLILARRGGRAGGLRVPSGLAAAARGAEELLTGNRPVVALRRFSGRAGRAALGASLGNPGRVLAVAAAL